MKFRMELSLEKENLNKDKNRIFLSYIKHIFEEYDKEFYNKLYINEENKIKEFTFALYMPNCIFKREEILIPDKKVILNFSTYDTVTGIMFFNSAMKNIYKNYKIKGNILTLNNIYLVKEKTISESSVIFKTMSPIVVRHHNGNNEKTWYYDLNELKGKEIFLKNLKYQLLNVFGKDRSLDIDEVNIEILQNKTVKVKNYDVVILSNISVIKVNAKSYILDYLYKGGIGSKRSSGYGMVDII